MRVIQGAAHLIQGKEIYLRAQSFSFDGWFRNLVCGVLDVGLAALLEASLYFRECSSVRGIGLLGYLVGNLALVPPTYGRLGCC